MVNVPTATCALRRRTYLNYATTPFFHHQFLELMARRMAPHLYVEFGVASGECISRVAPHCHRAIGVDLKVPRDVSGYELFLGSTEEFAIRKLPELDSIDLLFIDADHRFEQSIQDFNRLLPKISNDGLIVLHDTYPENKQWLAVDHCADSYRTADELYTRCHQLGVEVVTLPFPPGITIVRKRSSQLAWM